ncbi:MAG: calcium/sodium antiporter [Steroidobacteraceae bacterium]|jgi:cation:H+ antiporter|nr:calcium/sodium antiporter [Steroidobacteraceae bacterium]
MTIVLLIAGLALLVAGGELLVRGASKLALALGISPLVVGLTVVAFGTSSPELAVSVQAVASGNVDIALGNVVGSNLFNVLFILGLSALVVPLVVDAQMIRQEVPVMIGVSLLLYAMAWDRGVTRAEGLLLVALLAAYTVLLIWQSRRETQATRDEYAAEGHVAAAAGSRGGIALQVVLIVSGLVLLVFGSRFLVQAATTIARSVGISELVIGLTIVAAGTSLPEVAASVTAAIRGQRDIAVGNVVGSNTFNILGVLGLSASISDVPLGVAPSMLAFDIPAMLAVAVACLPVFFTGRSIARWEGAVFLGYYAAYTAWLLLASQEHDALVTYSLVMRTVVLPLTALTLLVTFTRAWRAGRDAAA